MLTFWKGIMMYHTRNNRLCFRVALVIAVSPSVSLLHQIPQASAVPDPVRTSVSKACKNADQLLIAARGSGENEPNKMGPTMTAVYNAMADKGAANNGGATRVNAIAVDYPARWVWDIPLVAFGNVGYFDGITDGVTKTVKLQQQVQTLSECESVTVSLGGYSQGAMVMHRVIQLFDAPQLRKFHVSSAVLIADGDRIGTDTGVIPYGSAQPTTSGIGQVLPVLAGSSNTTFNDTKDIAISSVCEANDAVCAPDWSVPNYCTRGCAAA